MATLANPASMDEWQLRYLGQKLVRFGLIRSFIVVDNQELIYHTLTKFPVGIVQNTKNRNEFKHSRGLSGHWVCYFVKREGFKFQSYYYDSLGHPHTYFDISSPPNTINTNLFQHQSNASKLCSLFSLFFIVACSLGYSPIQIFQLFNKDNLEVNDRLMLEFYAIFQTSGSRRQLIRRFTALLKSWCRFCGNMFCSCKFRNKSFIKYQL